MSPDRKRRVRLASVQEDCSGHLWAIGQRPGRFKRELDGHLTAISANADESVIAAGDGVAAHFDGRDWVLRTVPTLLSHVRGAHRDCAYGLPCDGLFHCDGARWVHVDLAAKGIDGHWGQEASITAYVATVKAGSKETVNCGASGIANTDAHIEIALDDGSTAKTPLVIVETTPRWRWFRGDQGTDWSTATLRTQLVGRCATFTGWMFFDEEDDDEAQNTAPNWTNKWRATAWEVHPVTGIQVVPCSN